MVAEFKNFAVKGNVLDMAVGIVIGVAFNKIVSSLVNDIVMPPIGLMISGVPFEELKVVLAPAVLGEAGEVLTPAVAIRYGLFINTMIEFVVIAITLFVVVKVMNRLIRKRDLARQDDGVASTAAT